MQFERGSRMNWRRYLPVLGNSVVFFWSSDSAAFNLISLLLTLVCFPRVSLKLIFRLGKRISFFEDKVASGLEARPWSAKNKFFLEPLDEGSVLLWDPLEYYAWALTGGVSPIPTDRSWEGSRVSFDRFLPELRDGGIFYIEYMGFFSDILLYDLNYI